MVALRREGGSYERGASVYQLPGALHEYSSAPDNGVCVSGRAGGVAGLEAFRALQQAYF
jgi:hypothetical protein